ncbi:alpha/beta-hydrolase [Cadophora sp. DSE1049]|nr:alpha/beta-hydrolase [Cadophora sp. DSE1049]
MNLVLLLPAILIAASTCSAQSQGISTALLSRLQKISTIALATYNYLVWILHEDISPEIILTFRGTNPGGTKNQKANANTTLGNFESLPICAGCQELVVTSHSLGGSMAIIAAAQLSATYQNLTVFSLGEPRTGNATFASFIDARFKSNNPETTTFYRRVREHGPVKQSPPLVLGYVHHGLEIWNRDPMGMNTSYFCNEETMMCSGSQENSTLENAHGSYWGRGFVECS